MYGISDHAYARALVAELHHAGIDARITDVEDSHEWPQPTLVVEEQERELVIQEPHSGGLPWSRFHSAGGMKLIILELVYLGEILPTNAGMESVVNAVKEILQ